MKIDRNKPVHWILLLLFGVQAALGLIRRKEKPEATQPRYIILYGHMLNGNLLAIYNQLAAEPEYSPVFISMDHAYCSKLRKDNIACCFAITIRTSYLLSKASAVISDHGLHSLEPLIGRYQKRGLRFFDVWHGIPFKGFTPADFLLQHEYDEIWVASPFMKKMYVEKFGFQPDKIAVTGYARTDRLSNLDSGHAHAISKTLDVTDRKVILYAPTWKQDAEGRSIFPFNLDEAEFLSLISKIARQSEATVLIRTHLNTRSTTTGYYENVKWVPSTDWPDTETILEISDILICDWSSIAFDYLLIHRPTIFLDVPAPFKNGFSLGPDYRFGYIATSSEQLEDMTTTALLNEARYWHDNRAAHQRVMEIVYDKYADGKSTNRCVARLNERLTS